MARTTAQSDIHPASGDPGPPEGMRLSRTIDRVLNRFVRMIRSVGRARGLDDGEMDELIQDVRIRLWRARSDAESIEALSTSYLYRTAMAAAVDLIRRRRKGRATTSLTLGEQVAGVDDPQRDLGLVELTERVREALADVQESRRVVVQLHLAGYPKPEIAELMGYSFAKVRNLLYRGLADLRGALETRGVPGSGGS